MVRENSIETCILSRVKQITSPGWMHETSARAWCTGRPRGIRWGGRWEQGSGWGIHVNPWLIHVNVWQKPLQNCKVISLQLIKINGKKKIKPNSSIIQEKKRFLRRGNLISGLLRVSSLLGSPTDFRLVSPHNHTS